jgi:hypothetical protein
LRPIDPAGCRIVNRVRGPITGNMAEREGFEPACRTEAKSLENADLVMD